MHDFGDIVILKEPDRCNPGGSGVETALGVFESNASEGEDRDVVLASAAESLKASWFCTRRIFLFEDWSEERQVGAVPGGLLDIVRGMAGLADYQADRIFRLS